MRLPPLVNVLLLAIEKRIGIIMQPLCQNGNLLNTGSAQLRLGKFAHWNAQ
jgi:hypothetical protein